MYFSSDSLQLKCVACGWSETCSLESMPNWLQAAGMLRRNSQPSVEELRELCLSAGEKLQCPDCQRKGLVVSELDDDEFDWPEAKQCMNCGSTIPPDRLEVFPNATHCVACQQSEEVGGMDDSQATEEMFCPRCGSLMITKLQSGSGVSRYAWVCGNYPRCRG